MFDGGFRLTFSLKSFPVWRNPEGFSEDRSVPLPPPPPPPPRDFFPVFIKLYILLSDVLPYNVIL